MSCLLITLIKCIKGHKSFGSLFEGLCLCLCQVMSPHHSDRMSQISQIFYGRVFQNGVGVIQSVTKPLSEGQLKDLLIITVLPAERMITAGWVPVDAVWCAIEPRTKGEKYLVDMLKKITSSSANNRQVVGAFL